MPVKRKINLSAVFDGQLVGIREVEDKIWQVSFMEYDPGFFDEDENRVEPASNPFTPKVLPMCPVRTWNVWCRREELNLRPTRYECVALPTELLRR